MHPISDALFAKRVATGSINTADKRQIDAPMRVEPHTIVSHLFHLTLALPSKLASFFQ